MATWVYYDLFKVNQDNTVVLSVLAVLGSCVAGLIWVIKHLFTEIKPVLGNISDATLANTRALEKLSSLTEKNTKATQAADAYLRERNGRDGKMWNQVMHSLEQISSQTVGEQYVGKQMVNKIDAK